MSKRESIRGVSFSRGHMYNAGKGTKLVHESAKGRFQQQAISQIKILLSSSWIFNQESTVLSLGEGTKFGHEMFSCSVLIPID